MFLRISYDKWHGILAVMTVAIVFTTLFFMIMPVFHLSPLLSALVAWLFAVGFAHYLQSVNEVYQALDRNVEKKYGSYQNFQENSRRDYKWFWYGIAVSWILPLLLLGVTYL